MESAKFTINKAVQAIQALDLGEDTCSISSYIKKKIQSNDISKIMPLAISDISPAVYSLFQHSQSTSASVEKSFFMIKKLLAKDRNNSVKNVNHCNMILHCNSCMW